MEDTPNLEIPLTGSPSDDTSMPLWEHLEELRGVLIKSLLIVSFGFCFTYAYSEKLIQFLEVPILSVLPAGEKSLYFTGITDKFVIYLKVSFYSSLIVTAPLLLKQLWNFVSPAIKPEERRFAIPFLLMGSIAFFIGVLFSYYIVIPSGYRFLIEFGGPNEKPLINMADYFSLTLQLLVSIGALFEVPVVAVILAKLGVLQPNGLIRFRPQAYLGLALVAAVLTPTPDAFTLVLVLIPLILLYELSVQMVRWMA
jgi:sec-independent protein translocase protein TatC